METVVIIILCLIVIGFLLKLTFHGLAGVCVSGIIMAGYVVCSIDFATTQSKVQIAEWLSNPELMLDASVWITVDVAFQICFCVVAATRYGMNTLMTRERIIYEICLWVPGILIFPALSALLTSAIFNLPGYDFNIVGWVLAATLLVTVPLLSTGIRYLLPEQDLRMELMFMVNLLIAALGVVATVNGRTAAVGADTIDWTALGSTSLLVALASVGGLLLYRYQLSKQIKKIV